MTDFDVVVIGGGPGGYIAAERLGKAGKKVLLAEAESPGGTCLNVGCIPTKSLLASAKQYAHALESAPLGVNCKEVSFDWAQVQQWKTQTVSTLVAGVSRLMKSSGVELRKEWATLLQPGKVRVGEKEITCKDVIIATGSLPVMPPIPGGKDNPVVVDSTGILATKQVPEKLVVIGGGVIGVEFASVFSALGSQVHIVEMLPEVLPFMDDELAAKLREAMAKAKNPVHFHMGSKVQSIDGNVVKYTNAEGTEETLEADLVLMAVGRRPAVEGWGAQEAGLHISRSAVVVNDNMSTNLPGVWAVGDVTGRSLLAHAAYRMGEIAAAHIIDPAQAARSGQVLRERCIPWALYSMPEAAGVGLSEKAALAAGYDVAAVSVPLVLSGRFIAENGTKAPGAVKIIAQKDNGRVLGIQMLGPYAPETIWGAAACLEQELSVYDMRQLVFPHPTVSEGIREAAWAIKI